MGNFYLLGYKSGANDFSWSMPLFFDGLFERDTKLSHADVMKKYKPKFSGRIAPTVIEKCDYYIMREF